MKKRGKLDGNGDLTRADGLSVNRKDSNGHFHSDWLNMMYPRLFLARNLLKQDGVIFVSIDDNEVHNLRMIMNEIFGEENFVAEFVWRRTDNQPNIGNIAKVKEYILCYTKNIVELKMNKMELTERAKKEYRYSDKKGKFRRAILLDKTRGRHRYEIKTPKGKILDGPWMIKKNDFEELEKTEGIYWTNGGDEQPYGKIYLEESAGQISNDFLGIEFGTNQQGSLEVEKLFGKRFFDFPKPASLIRHFITISTSNDDIILDLFAGSGTTAHAVMEQNAEDGGNIAIDQSSLKG
jgi:adenine-specific DNA-methyltransferase